MANERLRHAITQAGLEPERLADLVEVDVKTVERWISGVVPHRRRRTRIAQALGREEHELWPEIATAPPQDHDSADEIQGVWARADAVGALDWQELLEEAIERVELLDYSLLDVLATGGVIDKLAAKANDGCRVRVVIAAPDSIWVRARARELGLGEEDLIGRSRLALEINTARGHLEPLTRVSGIQLCEFYANPGYRILRFDDEMLVTPEFRALALAEAPVIHLRREPGGTLFDQFEAHLDALARDAGRPIEPAPEIYPDPATHPEDYEPRDPESQARLAELAAQEVHNAQPGPPLEQVRAELRRPPEPTTPTNE